MEKLMNEYNNQILKVNLLGIDYNAIFRIIEGSLSLEVEFKEANKLRNILKKGTVKIINGVYKDRAITMINSYIYKSLENKVTFKIDIMLDGFLVGKSSKNKRIKKFICSYYGMEEFDLSPYYDFDVKNIAAKGKCERDSFCWQNGNLHFHRTNEVVLGINNFSFNKVNEFEFCYEKKVDIFTAIEDIWHLRNLFSLLSQKSIVVKNIELYCSKKCSAKLYMNGVKIPDYKSENEFIEHQKNSFIINYEDIKNNFEEIINNSEICFKRIEAVIDMYLDFIEKDMPTLNKFLAFNQMLECFSREYDQTNAYSLMITKEPIKVKKEPELKYRINSLLKKVNFIYNFRGTKLFKLSEKVAKGRNYYIHHDKSKIKDKLSDHKIFQYSYFMEDILLANIYLELGIDKKIIKSAFSHPFYYTIKNL